MAFESSLRDCKTCSMQSRCWICTLLCIIYEKELVFIHNIYILMNKSTIKFKTFNIQLKSHTQ